MNYATGLPHWVAHWIAPYQVTLYQIAFNEVVHIVRSL